METHKMDTVRHLLDIKGDFVWSITPDEKVIDALRLMEAKSIGALMVMEGDRLVGVISERDYARKIVLQGKHSWETPVREIMTAAVITIHPDQTLDECMQLMSAKSIRHLPVVENEKVIGVVSVMDVMRAIIHRQREMIKESEPHPYT
jgi:CBS domain-containing protein